MKVWSSARAVMVALAVICLGFAVGTPARAQVDPIVTLFHGIPDAPVDVLVDGAVVFADFAPGESEDLSPFAGQTLKQLEVRLAGTTTVVIGPADFPVPSGQNVTVLAHLDADGKPTVTVFDNDTNLTKAGEGRLTVVHAAAAPAVDLVVGDARPIENLSNGEAQALELPAGTISGAKLAPTGQDPAIDVPTVEIKAGYNLIVYAVGSLAGGTFTFYTQEIKVGEGEPSPSPTPTPTPVPSWEPGEGRVTLLHGVPGVPVDVLLNGEVVFANFQPDGRVSLDEWRGKTLTQLEVRLAGTDTTILGPGDVEVPAEGIATLLVHLNADGAPELSIVTYKLGDIPVESDKGVLSVVHAAAAPAVDLVVGTERPITNLANGEVESLSVPSGTISGAKLAPTGGNPIADVPAVKVGEGYMTIVYVVGSLDEGTLTYYTQEFQLWVVDRESTSPSPSPTNKLPPTGWPLEQSDGRLVGWGLLMALAAVVAAASVSRRRSGLHR